MFKKDGLLKLTKEELKNVAKEYNIKAVLAKKKAEIIDAILKTQVSVFHDFLARELSFHNDIIEPTKGKRKPPESAFRYIAAKEFKFHDDIIEPSRREREPPYSVTETRSRFAQKYNTTEVDYIIKINKIMEVENAINAMIAHAKKQGNYKEGDKMRIVASTRISTATCPNM